MAKTTYNYIISIVLVLTLILSLMPGVVVTASSAKTIEVETEGETLVEAEENLDCVTATNSRTEPSLTTQRIESQNASGGEFLYSQNYDSQGGTRTHYWEYGFKVTQNGVYTVKARVGRPWRYRFHGMTATFGETTVINLSSMTTGNELEWGEYEKDISLTAGTTYAFKIETTCGTGGNHALYVDYVSVTPKELEPPIPSENEKVTILSGTTKIEAEEHTIVTNYLKTTASSGEVIEKTEPYCVNVDDDDTIINYNYSWNNITGVAEYYQTVTWTIPIEITKEGNYELEYCANQSAHYHGNLYAVLDGAELVQFENVAKGTPELITYKTTQTLKKGTHTISVVAKRAWNLNCVLVVDYVSVKLLEDEPEPEQSALTVSETETTIIEAEDYAKTYVNDNGTITEYEATIKTDIETASGGEYIFNNKGGTIEGAEHYWEITLDVQKEGVYEFTITIPTLSRYRFHSVKATIGNIELYNESSSWPLYNNEMVEFNDKTIGRHLKAGIYQFRFYAGKGTGGNQQLSFDSLRIKPLLNDEKNLKYEYENYVDGNASVQEVSGASDGKVVFGYTTTEHSYQIPVEIGESRYYDISYVVNKKTDDYRHSKIGFSLNLESDFPLPFTNQTPEVTVLDYTANEKYVLCLYEYKSIWINEDDYILQTTIDKTKDGYLKYELDYIEIKPTESPEITQSSTLKIELETFAGVGVYAWDRGVTEMEGTSGGKAVFDSWSDIDPSWSFPVKVKDSGFYHINYAAGDKYKPWYSQITFKLGKVILGTNIDEYVEDCGYLLWESQPLCKYRSEWIWLDEGEYELSVEIDPDEINNVYKYQADYIEFVPAVNGISMEYGVIKLHAAYTDVTNGKVLMAVYNGSKLVGTSTYDLENETYVDFEYVPEETVTKVKVFIWDEDNLAKPKELSKNFDLTENY